MEDTPIRYTPKKDKYVRPRGGNSHFLDLYCSKCNRHLALYQNTATVHWCGFTLTGFSHPKTCTTCSSMVVARAACRASSARIVRRSSERRWFMNQKTD